MTKTQRFDDYDMHCEVKLSVYDSSNILVGSDDIMIDVPLNETARKTLWIYADESGTDYRLKISPTKE